MNALSRFVFPVTLALVQVGALGQSAPVYTWRNCAGAPGSPGTNDGAGGAARFSVPAGVAADNAGNLFVADTYNCTIRQVSSGGVVTTLAGLAGSGGTNDGTGSAARFWYPAGVAADSAGTLYVADQLSHTIRQITSGGAVSTLAGSAGNSGTNDGTGSAARFWYPVSVAVDQTGNVYVADYYNHTIRRIASGGVVTTLAGLAGSGGTNDGMSSEARFYYPSGVAVDSTGDLYVADSGNHTIRKVTSAGLVTTLAGQAETSGTNDGPGSAARFYYPQGVAVDSAGNVFVADRYNHTIRKVTSAGAVTTLGGDPGLSGASDGPGSAARFNSPYGVAVDGTGNIYVADTGNHRISRGAPLPALAIRRSNNSLIVSWPSPSAGFVLQQNSEPARAVGWQTSDYTISDDGTNKSISVSLPAPNLFFRLSTIAPPSLSIRRSGSSVIVSWPSSAAGFVLEQNASVANAAGWSASGYSIADDGTNKSIILPSPAGKLFFRLRSD